MHSINARHRHQRDEGSSKKCTGKPRIHAKSYGCAACNSGGGSDLNGVVNVRQHCCHGILIGWVQWHERHLWPARARQAIKSKGRTHKSHNTQSSPALASPEARWIWAQTMLKSSRSEAIESVSAACRAGPACVARVAWRELTVRSSQYGGTTVRATKTSRSHDPA